MYKSEIDSVGITRLLVLEKQNARLLSKPTENILFLWEKLSWKV